MKENQRIALTKRLLQEGLLQLLKEKDIEKIKVTELCEASGINRATFYRHYELPRDVLVELRHSMFLELESITRAIGAEKNPQRTLEALCSYCSDHAGELTVLFEARADEGFAQLLSDFYQAHLAEYHLAEERLHMDLEELLLLSHYYAGGIYAVLRRWLSQPGSKSPVEVAAMIWRVITADTGRLPGLTEE